MLKYNLTILLSFTLIISVLTVNKYSEAANKQQKQDGDTSFRDLQKPYRMAKLNMLWSKAQVVSNKYA